jgi:hypothetical protein
VAKAAEALVLLQTLAASNFGRLVARLDAATRGSLRDLTLRELAFGSEAQKVAATLVTLLVEEAQGSSAAVADDLTAHLQVGGGRGVRGQSEGGGRGGGALGGGAAGSRASPRPRALHALAPHTPHPPPHLPLCPRPPGQATAEGWRGTEAPPP